MIVHIVPSVPPDINGVADYCYKLWQHWPQPRPPWKCVAAHVPEEAKTAWPEAEIIPFHLSGPGLMAALDKAGARNVVLHYVGYAYHPKGVPLWLPSGLRAWKTKSQGRLCVMFHEVYASGTPRHSAFWLLPISKNIVRQLLEVADVWVTSCEAAATKLIVETKAQPDQGRIIPVGANIEPNQDVDFARPWPLARGTKLRIAVFGLPSSRIGALRYHQNLLKLLYEQNDVEYISLIGKSVTDFEQTILREMQNSIAPAAIWRVHHDLSPAEVSSLLLLHDIGLCLYSPPLLTKSTVFAICSAHGLITICARESPPLKKSSQNKEMSLGLPYLQNDDSQPENCLHQLHDASAIEQLKLQVCDVTQKFLNWQSITQAWAQMTADDVRGEIVS